MKTSTQRVTLAGLFAALIFAGTCISFEIPNGQGFVNFGDVLIMTAAVFIGASAVPAAAIGALFADIMLGFAIYAPATFIIKGLVALTAHIFIKLSDGKNGRTVIICAGFIIAELVMVGGYFLYELILYGFSGACVSVPFNCIQGVVGVIGAMLLRPIAERQRRF